MKLHVNERIVKVYHHHILFFIWRSIKVWGASLPFFLILYIFSTGMPKSLSIMIGLGVLIFFALVQVYDFAMYYLDTLVITNQRVVHLDWVNPFKYTETQASLDDIQDIETVENGFLSKIKILDFGSFIVETASTRTVIRFVEAPDPEGIKFFVTNLSRKHNLLEARTIGENKAGNTYRLNNNTEITNSKVVR